MRAFTRQKIGQTSFDLPKSHSKRLEAASRELNASSSSCRTSRSSSPAEIVCGTPQEACGKPLCRGSRRRRTSTICPVRPTLSGTLPPASKPQFRLPRHSAELIGRVLSDRILVRIEFGQQPRDPRPGEPRTCSATGPNKTGTGARASGPGYALCVPQAEPVPSC